MKSIPKKARLPVKKYPPIEKGDLSNKKNTFYLKEQLPVKEWLPLKERLPVKEWLPLKERLPVKEWLPVKERRPLTEMASTKHMSSAKWNGFR